MATLIYVIVGWFAWIVARAIVLDRPDRLRSTEYFTTPIVAAFILAGFDYPFDPIGATVQRLWTFTYPSGQYGVPISHSLGWLFTGWLLFQILAAVDRKSVV